MNNFTGLLGNVLNLRLLGFLIPLLVLVVLGGYLAARMGKQRKQKPGQHLVYRCETRTAAECRDLLGHKNVHDSFAYTLEPSPQGGLYLTLTQHIPTEQQLQTRFLLAFEAEQPAAFSLTFVSEAFGMREPVVPESLLDGFFAQKLDAKRVQNA